jgi:hypothetical protein
MSNLMDDEQDDLEMFAWLVRAVVKYDNVDLSRPEPTTRNHGLYGIGIGDPQENAVEWHYGETLREAIRAAMRSEFP